MKKLPLLFLLACANTFCLVAQPSIQWQKCLGGTNPDRAYSISQTTDGGYIVAGDSWSFDTDVTGNIGDDDFWIAKLSSTGILQWQKSLGGTWQDWAYSIQQTTDSGFIVAGWSASHDSDVTGHHGGSTFDYWIVKLNNTGTIQWQKSLGGTGHEVGYSICQTSDSGYIVAGNSNSNDGDVTGHHGNYDYWVVKLSSTGTIQWQKSLGGTLDDYATSVRQTTDSGYIVAGYSSSHNGDVTNNYGSSDYWVVKLDNAGIIQWQKTLGGSSIDEAYSIQQTTDGGYIIAGNSASNDSDVTGNHGARDFWIVKLNSTGSLQWQKALGGTGDDVARSIQQTTDGGYIAAGYSYSYNGDVTGHRGIYDYWIVKLDGTGILQWQKSLGGTGYDYGYAVQQTNDGGYIVAGGSWSTDSDVTNPIGNYDYWIVKLSSTLNTREITSPVSNLQIIPNPVSQSSVISFSLFQPGNISVNVYDITGRFVKNLFDGNLNSGNHEIKLNITDERVDAGVYLLNFNGNSFFQSFKLIVVE